MKSPENTMFSGLHQIGDSESVTNILMHNSLLAINVRDAYSLLANASITISDS